MPRFIEPMLASPAARPFDDPEWLFEVKWDGHRVQAHIRQPEDGPGRIDLVTRRNKAVPKGFSIFAGPEQWIDAHEAIVDGEVVGVDERGLPSFGLLQEHLHQPPLDGSSPLVLQAFDLLYLDGRSLLDEPLTVRRALLAERLLDHPRVRFSDHVEGRGIALYDAAVEQGLEGLIAKRADSPYRPGKRSASWLKLKVRAEQEFLVCGWLDESGGPGGLGSLALCVHGDDGFVYVGNVGSGFTDTMRGSLLRRLRELEVDSPTVAGVPPTVISHWTRAELVVKCEFAEWTNDGRLRHAVFKGIDDDADAAAIVREQPEPHSSAVEQLRALGASGTLLVGGREVALTNLDKVMFPATDVHPELTKRDLIAYYAAVAPVLTHHLAGRPVNLHRFPNGVHKPGFWHKAVPKHTPDWIRRWHRPDVAPDETQFYFVADEPATIVWLANYGAIELHPWTSTTDDPYRPSYALIDIDPGSATTWDDVLTLSRLYRTALDHLGVRGFPKVTGKRGIQIWVPVQGDVSFDDTRIWVEGLSRMVGDTVPDLVSWTWKVSDRGGRARLDFTQNAINKTLVAPYSVRATASASVSAPITWDELDDPDLRPDRWNISTFPERLAALGDLYADLLTTKQDLPGYF